MPKLDHTGPEGDGSQAGRGLGRCRKISPNEKLLSLGKGMGKNDIPVAVSAKENG